MLEFLEPGVPDLALRGNSDAEIDVFCPFERAERVTSGSLAGLISRLRARL